MLPTGSGRRAWLLRAGDTATNMMWLEGVSLLEVVHAYVAAGLALLIFGVPAFRRQQRHVPIRKDEPRHAAVDWARVWIVAFVVVAAIATNVVVSLEFKRCLNMFPFIGAAVRVAIVLCVPPQRRDRSGPLVMPQAGPLCAHVLGLRFGRCLPGMREREIDRVAGAAVVHPVSFA